MSGIAPRVPAHVATTRHLCAAYPLVSEAGLGHEGVLIGRDVLGGSFVYDPFALYGRGVVTNPNMVVFGQIGRGKSSFVKSYLWRQAVFGRHAWVIDPKGEYGPLAQAWGVEPVALRPGGPIRLNPLDTEDEACDDQASVRRSMSCAAGRHSPPRWPWPVWTATSFPASAPPSMPRWQAPPSGRWPPGARAGPSPGRRRTPRSERRCVTGPCAPPGRC